MNKTILFALLIFVFGCSDLKKGLGLIKDPPDEFLIKKIDPIERPPNYDLLPPDSKVKVSKKNNQNLKNILDENLNKNNSLSDGETINKQSSQIEDDILKQIKK
jgi:hypothetical protein